MQDLITIIYCDNQSAIALSENPKFHSKSKHIEMQVHYIGDKITNNEINIQFVRNPPTYKVVDCIALGGVLRVEGTQSTGQGSRVVDHSDSK